MDKMIAEDAALLVPAAFGGKHLLIGRFQLTVMAVSNMALPSGVMVLSVFPI